jgi:hypothetical protein
MAKLSEDVAYWVNEFRFQHADQATVASDQDMLEDGIEHTIERALESFESELRTALVDAMNDRLEQLEEAEREKFCIRCGEEITDDNRPDDRGWYGPDSGYCAPCAAAEE